MRHVTVGQRLRYWFDNTMARGPLALIGGLAILSAVLIVLSAGIVLLVGAPPDEGGQPRTFLELLWMALLRTLDPGTMGGDVGDWPFLATMLGVTLGGIFIVSTLIGILTSGLASRLDELRKGRSLVLETNHTLILGWSDQIIIILQ